MPYVDTLLREYLLFRGFTATLSTFNADKRNDRADRVDKVIDLIFRRHVPQLDVDGLMSTLALLRERFFSRLDGGVHQLMTGSMFHVTNLTPGSECNPSRAHGLVKSTVVHVTNLTPGVA